jgi:2-amino-4-hydroxy-6-hydroxymethyldihydropteridine diphosphokinase
MIDERKDPLLAFVGIGSNMLDPRRQVDHAIEMLDDLPGCRVVRRSSLYQSAPYGDVDQADFVNAVAVIETAVPPAILLSCFKELERRQVRCLTRLWVKWAFISVTTATSPKAHGCWA